MVELNNIIFHCDHCDVLLASHEQLKRTILAQREGTSDETLKTSSWEITTIVVLVDIKQKTCSGGGSDSLCSKLFRVNSEQRKTEERDFPPLFYSPYFSIFDSRSLFFDPKPHENA